MKRSVRERVAGASAEADEEDVDGAGRELIGVASLVAWRGDGRTDGWLAGVSVTCARHGNCHMKSDARVRLFELFFFCVVCVGGWMERKELAGVASRSCVIDSSLSDRSFLSAPSVWCGVRHGGVCALMKAPLRTG